MRRLFPTTKPLLGASGCIWDKYKVRGILTVVVIEAKGLQSAYLAGLHRLK